jgi:hypothetical protein
MGVLRLGQAAPALLPPARAPAGLTSGAAVHVGSATHTNSNAPNELEVEWNVASGLKKCFVYQSTENYDELKKSYFQGSGKVGVKGREIAEKALGAA